MKIFKNLPLLVLIMIASSCGESISYPSTFTFDNIEIEKSCTAVGISDRLLLI